MDDLENLLRELKSPKYLAPFVLICAICMIVGFRRGSVGGLVFGMAIGVLIFFIGIVLIDKHRERERYLKESIIIPKPGMTEKMERWLTEKKWRELKSEKRFDLVMKTVWWLIFALVGLFLLYWMSPFIYYLIQVLKQKF
jgi:hypothetical protein